MPDENRYGGFWVRLMASIIDTVLIIAIIYPALYAIYDEAFFSDTRMVRGGWDGLLSYVVPAVAVILFWVYRSATPGKMILGLRIVDARTGGKPSTGQFVGRYLAYYLSMLPLFLGFFWVGWDKRKQGLHDKLAGTVVIRRSRGADG